MDLFTVHRDTGELSLNKPLDREAFSSANITVQACDDGLPQLCSNATLSIEVLDVNDNKPKFLPFVVSTVAEVMMKLYCMF